MAADDCPGVIVSSNRADDVLPYASHIYNQEPAKWANILPWNFPQGVDRTDEETYLRLFFTENEIHMQGGAYGDGRGFRFLKTVWYANAEWNLFYRVPLVEEWFWSQKDSLALLDDPDMTPYFNTPGVHVSTFFQAKEKNIYGEHFLTAVVPRIQNTATIFFEQRKQSMKPNVVHISRHFTEVMNSYLQSLRGHVTPQVAQSVASENKSQELRHSAAHSEVSGPLPASQVSQPRLPSNGYKYGPDSQQFQHRRYSNNSKRLNNRSAQHYPPNSRPFDERGVMQHPATGQGGPIWAPNGEHRAYSAGQNDYMPPLTRGHAVPPPGFQPMHRVPPPYSHMSPMQQQVIPQGGQYMPGQQQQVYYDPHAFGNRGYPSPSENSHGHVNMQPDYRTGYGNRAGRGDRRNSMSGRGRGNGSVRGRGASRGRNSFGASDQSHQSIRGELFGANGGPQNNGANLSWKARQQTGMSRNWRSGRDHPQEVCAGSAIKETMAPSRAFSGPEYHQSQMGQTPVMSHPGPVPQSSNRPPSEQLHPSGHMPSQLPSEWQGAVYVPHSVTILPPRLQPVAREPVAHEPGTCTEDSISPECTMVTKLIVFDVPIELTEPQLHKMFSQWGEVDTVFRGRNYQFHQQPTLLVFINFRHAQAARAFLLNKPSQWLEGVPFRVKVPREYLDPEHHAYKRRVEVMNERNRAEEMRKGAAPEESPSVPTILRRTQSGTYPPSVFSKDRQNPGEMASEDTTPTPSGASTLKKTNKKKNKKSNQRGANMQQGSDLRKSPITNAEGPSIDEPALPETQGEASEQAKSHAPQSEQPEPTVTIPEQAEVQSSCEPTFSPSKNIKTQLPLSQTSKQEDQEPSAAASEEPSRASEVSRQRPSELVNAGSPPEQVNAPADSPQNQPPPTEEGGDQLFRENTKTQTQTQATEVDSPTLPAIIEEPETTLPPQETPSQETTSQDIPSKADDNQDDSFHTASGSPGSMNGTQEDENSKLTLEIPSNVPTLKNETSSAPVSTGTDGTTHVGSPVTSDTLSSRTFGRSSEGSNDEVPNIRVQKPKVTISTDLPTKEDEPKSEKRSTSGNTLPPPTPMFVTAPNTAQNTPVVGHDSTVDSPKTTSDGQEAPETKAAEITVPDSDPIVAGTVDNQPTEKLKEAAPASKKVEESKGPAQTESYSLFGKKKEKPKKYTKKGTIKGKPTTDDQLPNVSSGQSSRTESVGPTPLTDVVNGSKRTEGSKKGGDDKPSSAAPVEVLKPEQAAKTKAEPKAKSKDSADEPKQATVEETPSKRKGSKFTGFLSNMFGGGAQSQAPAQDASSTKKPSDESLLTDTDAQGLPLKSETKETASTGDDGGRGSGEKKAVANGDKKGTASRSVNGNDVDGVNAQDIFSSDEGKQGDDAAVGLGISDAGTGDGADDVAKSKKKKRRPKRKKVTTNADADAVEPSETSTPVTESQLPMLRFGEKDAFPVSIPFMAPMSPTADDQSVKSNSTAPGDTPASESQSPVTTSSTRKLPTTPTSNGHLVQAKKPTWKNKKRVLSGRTSEPVADEDDDDDAQSQTIHLINLEGCSDTSEQTSNGDATPPSDAGENGRPQKLYVYVGPGRRSEAEGGGRITQSKELAKEMAKAEVRRKFPDGPVAVGTGG